MGLPGGCTETTGATAVAGIQGIMSASRRQSQTAARGPGFTADSQCEKSPWFRECQGGIIWRELEKDFVSSYLISPTPLKKNRAVDAPSIEKFILRLQGRHAHQDDAHACRAPQPMAGIRFDKDDRPGFHVHDFVVQF